MMENFFKTDEIMIAKIKSLFCYLFIRRIFFKIVNLTLINIKKSPILYTVTYFWNLNYMKENIFFKSEGKRIDKIISYFSYLILF